MGGGRVRLECEGKRRHFTEDAPQAWLDAAFRLAQEKGRRKVFCAEVDHARVDELCRDEQSWREVAAAAHAR